MTPIDIRQYLSERKFATLNDIAVHFRKTTETVSPLLDLWIRKGKVVKYDNNLGCRKGCCKCDPAAVITYEWVGS